MKNRKKKAGVATIAASVITAGAVTVAVAYQNGLNFEPKDSNRKLQNNQVVFSDDQDQVEHTRDENGDDSELWEKSQDQQQDNSQDTQGKSDYVFQQAQQTARANALTVGVTGDMTGSTEQYSENTQTATGNLSGGSYQLTDDRANADLIINGTGTDQKGADSTTNTDTPGNGENGDQNTSDSRDDDSDHSGDSTDPEPSPKPAPDNGNHNSGTRRPSATAKDPEIKKEWSSDDGIPDNPFPDKGLSDIDQNEDGDSRNVVIMQKWEYDTGGLYKGQTIDRTMIYNSLDTYVWNNEGTFRYIWGEEALGEYVRIDAVSFDGGASWNSSFPLEIPENVDDDMMIIRTSYRLSKDAAWVQRDVNYMIESNRLYVLSKEIEEENTTIDVNTILNYDQSPEVGSVVNLFGIQNRYLGQEALTELFPGWSEDGELVPWLYKATAGRHILEPEKKVPLSENYTVQVKGYWMTDDYRVDSVEGNNYAFLQTLTNFADKAVIRMKDGSFFDRIRYDEVEVPKYVQAVDIDSAAELEVDYLKIPDTVLYLADSSTGLHVERGYLVDEDNPVYQSNQEGVLLNKAGTEILGIPYELEELTVPDTITKVDLPSDNQISRINLQAETEEELPQLNYKNLKNCRLVVPESFLEDYLKNNNSLIRQGEGVCVASADAPDITYTMNNGVILSNTGSVRRIYANDNVSVVMPNGARNLEADAFSMSAGIKTLILPKNGTVMHLKADSLKGSNITEIWCYSQKQYDTVKKELERSGAASDVRLELLQMSQEGYSYLISDGVVTLMNAPDDITEFDGTMTAGDGTALAVDALAEHSFADCEELEWVTLPESVSKIGYQAFENCKKLQGVLINATDSITIGNGAFDGCDSLRFVASNAEEGIMEEDYAPQLTDDYSHYSGITYFYIPSNSTGYFDGCTYFTEASGINGYDMVDIGGNARILYGLDDENTPWIALRSGGIMPDRVELPDSTIEIFSYAMADTENTSESYAVNWDELPQLCWIDAGAFRNSDLGGTIELGENISLDDNAFNSCKSITELTIPGDSIYIGQDAMQNCTGLKKITLGQMQTNKQAYFGLFSGCDNLEDIYFTSETPPELSIYGKVKFQFNFDWTREEEAERLRIHVPEGSETDYVMKWRYTFAGYTYASNQSAYQNMWEDIRMEHMDWDTWEFPSDEEINRYVEEALLQAENRVRVLLGAPTVSEPTELYQYSVDYNGIITLTEVPTYCTEISLEGQDLDLPDGWYLDNIGAGAFSRAKNLQKVTIPYSLVSMYSHALEGVESDQVTLVFEGIFAPDLMRTEEDKENGVPFSFGIDDSRLHIQVPEYCEDWYIDAWKYVFAGYDSAEEMWNAITEELTEKNGVEPSSDEILDVMNERLQASEDRLRALLGVEESDSDIDFPDWFLGQSDAAETFFADETAVPIQTQGSANEEETESGQVQKPANEEEETKSEQAQKPANEEEKTESGQVQKFENEEEETNSEQTQGIQAGASEQTKAKMKKEEIIGSVKEQKDTDETILEEEDIQE